MADYDLTREEAINALHEGKKIEHKYFTSDEYLVLEGTDIMTEDGYYYGDMIFKNDFMIDGWRIRD